MTCRARRNAWGFGVLLAQVSAAAFAGTLSGSVQQAEVPHSALSGITVLLFDASRSPVTQTTSAADGSFSFPGLAAGNYFLLTRKDDDARVDLAWPDKPCPQQSCGSFSDATPIAVPASGTVTIAPAFLLPLGATLSGSVTAAVGGAGLSAQIFGFPSSANFQIVTNTDASGNYSIPGIPTQSGASAVTYKVRANPTGASANYVGEVYNNIPCPHASCDLNTVGTPVSVSSGNVTTINFALDAGSVISGHAYDGPGTSSPVSAPGLTIWVYTAGGSFAGVASVFGDGSYAVQGLASGTYRAVLVGDDTNSFYVSQLWNGIDCFGAACLPPTGGTAIGVGTAATVTADFHLHQGMRIRGDVTDGASGAGVFTGDVHVFAGAATTDLGHAAVNGGHYALTLPAGSAIRLGVLTGGTYVDEMWNDHPCVGACPGTGGDPVTIVAGTEVVANFALDPGALGFYPITPCRALDTRTQNDPLPANTTREYTLGGTCPVPTDAIAIALNVTVVTPPSTGSLVLWPSETASVGTSTMNFKAGLTRANNAVLAVGHDVATGLNARLALSSAGSAHIVIDVVGYFR